MIGVLFMTRGSFDAVILAVAVTDSDAEGSVVVVRCGKRILTGFSWSLYCRSRRRTRICASCWPCFVCVFVVMFPRIGMSTVEEQQNARQIQVHEVDSAKAEEFEQLRSI
jgi:hypothetical protein